MGVFSMHYHYAISLAGATVKDASKTLIQLMSLPEYENVIHINVGEVAKKVGITTSALYRHINTIREAGLIIPHESCSELRTISSWRLCPFLGWKGTAVALNKYLSTLPVNHSFFKYADPEWLDCLKAEIENEKLEDVL